MIGSGGGGITYFYRVQLKKFFSLVAREVAVFPIYNFHNLKVASPGVGVAVHRGWCLVNVYSVRDYIQYSLSSTINSTDNAFASKSLANPVREQGCVHTSGSGSVASSSTVLAHAGL